MDFTELPTFQNEGFDFTCSVETVILGILLRLGIENKIHRCAKPILLTCFLSGYAAKILLYQGLHVLIESLWMFYT